MPDHTTSSAAEYLKGHGYTVKSKKHGTEAPPPAELIKRWCERGKLKARKAGWSWLINQEELDRIIAADLDAMRGELRTLGTTDAAAGEKEGQDDEER